MANGLPPFSERLKDVIVYEIIPSYDESGNFVDAQVNCDDLDGASVWFSAKLSPDLKIRPTFATSGPRFTGQFDPPDYEAFFLELTSHVGLDEGTSAEKCAEIIKGMIPSIPLTLYRVTYRHKKAGQTDEAYVRATASGNALLKFAGTCVQPEEIDVISCEEVEVNE